ncbi:MAG: prephenate dehydratase [Coriobacteriia bacterium]|nr:prephenate dehydratase [Coriobacteriia bacterium]
MNTEQTIAYLGPEGTYCNEAARRFAERMELTEPEFLPCTTFDEIFEVVDRGKVAFGVVATENSLEGAVTSTLDNFAFQSTCTILGEEVIDIHHCLLLHPEAELSDVTTVVSHAQGLAQCRRFLNEKLPGRDTITTSSTAASAQMCVRDKSVASIANALAAELHGAKILEPDVQDRFGNQTKFALIGRPGTPPVFTGEKYKTSLALFLQADRVGALLMILEEFAYANVNLTMLQSRPTKQGLGDYMFLVDIEGHVNEPAVQTALNCLRLKLREVKVLGCYPVD